MKRENADVIEKLFWGELCPSKECERVVERYKVEFEKKKEMENSFFQRLTEEQKREYEELMQQHFMLSGEELYEAFQEGYHLAIQLIFQGLK